MSNTQDETPRKSKGSSMSIKKSRNDLRNALRDNLDGCDILLCLFMAALGSYKPDVCVIPFPSVYRNKNYKDIAGLRNICADIPPLKYIAQNPDICSNELVELLVWLFCRRDQAILKKVPYNEVHIPFELQKSLRPSFVFSVVHPKKFKNQWQKRKGSHSLISAYHGDRLQKFYSLCKVGFLHQLGEKQIPEFHFSTEITVAMAYSPVSRSWTNSIFGEKQSLLALCDIIDHSQQVKYIDFEHTERASTSSYDTVRQHYLVVTDRHMIRAKYIFVYKDRSFSAVHSWVRNNLALVSILIYLVIFLCFAFFQGSIGKKIMKRLYRLFSE